MSQRPLLPVAGITIADYLLWHWSLNSGHEVLALISGLTLPPLGLACIWLFALSAARVIAGRTRRPARLGGRDQRAAAQASGAHRAGAPAAPTGPLDEGHTGSAAASGSPSGKLAA